MQNTLKPTPIGKLTIEQIIGREVPQRNLTTPYFTPAKVEMERPKPLAKRLSELRPDKDHRSLRDIVLGYFAGGK